VGSASGGRRFVELFFDYQLAEAVELFFDYHLAEVSLEYSFTPDINGSSGYLELSIVIEDDDLLLKSTSDLYGALVFKYEDEPLGHSKPTSSFYMEYFIYEYEVRSMRRIARRRGGGRSSAKMTVMTRSFLSFLSWSNFLRHEARGRKARGDVAAYTSQPMPLV
jgi:hypothetical protein